MGNRRESRVTAWRSRWHRGLPAAAVVALALALGACGSSSSSSTGGGSGASGGSGKASSTGGGGTVGKGQIKIGADIELSGRASLQGAAYQKAFRIAVDNINSHGGINGKKIQIIVRDNGSDPTQSLEIVKGFINQHVAAIIGGGTSPTTLSVVDTAEKAKIPLVSMGSSGAIIKPAAERKYVFKTVPNTDVEVVDDLAYMKQHGIKKVAILSADNAYGDAGLNAFKELGPSSGVQVAANAKVNPEDHNYTSQLTKLIGTQPDALVFWALPPTAGTATQEARQLGWTSKPIYETNGIADPVFFKSAGSAADGVITSSPQTVVADQVPASAKNKQKMVRFVQAFGASGVFPQFASYGADAVGLLANAIKQAGSTDHQAIRNALEHESYVGVTGVFHMSPQNHSGLGSGQLGTLAIQNHQFKLLRPATGR